jgi:hypothetical protein
LLSTLLDSGFGASLMTPCVDVILTKGTLSGVSATHQCTFQSLYYSAPYYHSPCPTNRIMLFNTTSKM